MLINQIVNNTLLITVINMGHLALPPIQVQHLRPARVEALSVPTVILGSSLASESLSATIIQIVNYTL